MADTAATTVTDFACTTNTNACSTKSVTDPPPDAWVAWHTRYVPAATLLAVVTRPDATVSLPVGAPEHPTVDTFATIEIKSPFWPVPATASTVLVVADMYEGKASTADNAVITGATT